MVVWGQGPLLTLSCAPDKCKKKNKNHGGQCLIDSPALPATSDSHSRPDGQRSVCAGRA